jgi:hypothetical protein
VVPTFDAPGQSVLIGADALAQVCAKRPEGGTGMDGCIHSGWFAAKCPMITVFDLDTPDDIRRLEARLGSPCWCADRCRRSKAARSACALPTASARRLSAGADQAPAAHRPRRR